MTSQHNTSKYPGMGLKPQSGAETENLRKRKEPPHLGRECSPPSKALKPGSTLDQTLQKLTQQLIKRKLDEQRQEMQQAESGKSDAVAKESAESRKSRRKALHVTRGTSVRLLSPASKRNSFRTLPSR